MRFVLSLAVLAIAVTSFAVSPQYWRVTSPEDFLAGEIEGMVVTSRGELKPGPAVKKIASFEDPFVLSQTTDGSGRRFFGTGNAGKVYRLDGETLKLLFTAPEPEIYALAFSNGSLIVGSSPNGKIYKVNPADGSSKVLYDPKQGYIWEIAVRRDGTLLVATGVEGKLFKVSPDGTGTLFYDAPETHIRSLALLPENRTLAGGAGEGRIYEIDPEGRGRALYDAAMTEISAITYDDATKTAWAAGVTNVLPTTAPAAKSQQTTTQKSGEEKKSDEGSASTVDISFSFDDQLGQLPTIGGAGELYRIDRDGFVEVARRFEREIVYSLTTGKNGSVFLSTGPQGRIYEYRDGDVSLIAAVPEKQVVSFSGDNGPLLVTTTNAGAVYRIDSTGGSKAEYVSSVKDVERFSRFGHFRVEGKDLDRATVKLSFRSGNTSTPDETWSAWFAAPAGTRGQIPVPPARYLQWKVAMEKAPAGTTIDDVVLAYVNRNVAPTVTALQVLEPGAIILTGAYPPAPQVVEATNPDEFGIFSGLDTARDRNDPGKRMFRKGFRTISWKALDVNGDSLRYNVSFRMKGRSDWLRLRDNVEETQLNFDTSQLPDGLYEIRLVATDAQDNPENPLTDSKEGAEFLIDNSSPTIASSRNGGNVVVTVRDAMSPVIRAEYSVDAKKWNKLVPVDGIADSTSEQFSIPGGEGQFIVVRALDASYNVATESVK